MSVCPTCESTIDLMHSTAVVVGAKVVTYCSIACRDRASEQAADRGSTAVENTVSSSASSEREDDSQAGPSQEVIVVPASRHEYMTSRARGTRKNKIVVLSAAIMVGGMAITIINAVSPSTPSDVRAAERNRTSGAAAMVDSLPASDVAARDPADGVAHSAVVVERPDMATSAKPPTEPEVVPLSPSELEAKAETVLRGFMESTSERIRRIAAMALSRKGDEQALAYLVTLLEKESGGLRKVELAYAVARSGNLEAKKMLRRRLRHKRRDVRVDAARSLIALGDDSGVPVLERMLSLRTHRLGAAGLLARLGASRGLKVLRKELKSRKASDENKIRAAVALGRAGDESVRERLQALLADPRYHVGAADALATLGDYAAVEALEKQLALPSLRVRAALGLRRMNREIGHEVLGSLAVALDQGHDPGRVSAAEAILILVGPKHIAERD